MKVKRFAGFDASKDPEEGEIDEDIDIIVNKKFTDFLARDGKDIRIRKIAHVSEYVVLIYYDELGAQPKPQKNNKPFNRFTEIDMV